MVDLIKSKKVGIFGGSFDPVHLGHTGLAVDAKKQASLEKVIFVPAKLQPFKLDKEITSGRDRLNMLTEAIKGLEGMEISDYEIKASGVSYTYLTMRQMQEFYGKSTKLYFIMGTDSFLTIERWKNSEELMKNYSYIVGVRPGYRYDELQACVDRIRKKHDTEIINIRNIQVDVSSTEIRQAMESGNSAKGLVSEGVERYIKENGLYKYSYE